MIYFSVAESEILWALHCSLAHQSVNSNDQINFLFKRMFSDSTIAQNFKCHRTKLTYLVNFGLAPYFSSELLEELNKVDHFVIMFDESYNSVIKANQMDIHLRFFCDITDQVRVRYLGSQFLMKGDAKTMQKHFNEQLSGLDQAKVIQLSMDGPSVNLKFYKEYCQERKQLYPDAVDIIDIGVCGLHVVHNAFKTSITKTDWDLGSLLSAAHNLFSDTYARRSDYTEVTGSGMFNGVEILNYINVIMFFLENNQ